MASNCIQAHVAYKLLYQKSVLPNSVKCDHIPLSKLFVESGLLVCLSEIILLLLWLLNTWAGYCRYAFGDVIPIRAIITSSIMQPWSHSTLEMVSWMLPQEPIWPTKSQSYLSLGKVFRVYHSLCGTSTLTASSNYRLGAFGWLAGSYMEKHAQPNAGLLDQRAILKFVRDNIAGVKGDPGSVSVWGQSAGASSILHHLTMPKTINDKPPLFKRAIL